MKKAMKSFLGVVLMVGGIVFCASEAETLSMALFSGVIGLFLFVFGLYVFTGGS